MRVSKSHATARLFACALHEDATVGKILLLLAPSDGVRETRGTRFEARSCGHFLRYVRDYEREALANKGAEKKTVVRAAVVASA